MSARIRGEHFLRATRRAFPPSPRFENLLNSDVAVLLAWVLAVGALAGAAAGIWRGEWIDALVRFALGLVFAVWAAKQMRQRRGRPPRRAG